MNTMTRKEAAIITAHTGHLVGYLDDFYEYVNLLFGRVVSAKEVPHLTEEIRRRSKADFYELIKNIKKGE